MDVLYTVHFEFGVFIEIWKIRRGTIDTSEVFFYRIAYQTQIIKSPHFNNDCDVQSNN